MTKTSLHCESLIRRSLIRRSLIGRSFICKPLIRRSLAGKTRLRAAAMALALLALPLAMFASLGGDATSIQSDQVRLRAEAKATQKDSYTIQEIKSPSGTVVREYVADGKVFGVAWRGPFLPDLHQILGTSFVPFTQAVRLQKNRRPGHGPVAVRQSGLVVFSGGHQRDYFGTAYLPGLMPKGVSAEEIR